MKKLISLILVVFILFSFSACKDKNNDKNQQGNNNNNLLVDENANANQKKIIRTTFSYTISEHPEGFDIPEGWYGLPYEKIRTNFLEAYEGKAGYFNNVVKTEKANPNMTAISYLLIDDIDTLSAVLATTGTYTLNDIYPLNVLNNHFIIAVFRMSTKASTNGSLYTVNFDEANKTLNISQEPYHSGWQTGNAAGWNARALDLVPIERSVLNGVDLKDVNATLTVLEQVWEDEFTSAP